MALIETIILYCQLTLGIANPTSSDLQSAEQQLYGTTTTTTSYVTSSPTDSEAVSGWDIYETN